MAAPFHVVFALYPRITQLDFTGPYEVLTRLPGARCVLALGIRAMKADILRATIASISSPAKA